MNVVIADIRDDHLAAAQAELGAPGSVLAVKLDVNDRANAMITSVPAHLPENPACKDRFAMLFYSPIWGTEIARQQGLKP